MSHSGRSPETGNRGADWRNPWGKHPHAPPDAGARFFTSTIDQTGSRSSRTSVESSNEHLKTYKGSMIRLVMLRGLSNQKSHLDQWIGRMPSGRSGL